MSKFKKAVLAAVVATAFAFACAAFVPPVEDLDPADDPAPRAIEEPVIEEPESSITRTEFDLAWDQTWKNASAEDRNVMCEYWHYDPVASAEAFMIGFASKGMTVPVEWYHSNIQSSCGRGA